MKREDPVGFYQITYKNGMTQKKELITVNDHNWYQEMNKRKGDLLELISIHKKKNKKKKVPVDPAITNELKEIDETIKREFKHEFFVVGSPMYKALTTGVIQIDKPAGNAGSYEMTAVEIPYNEM